MEYSSIIPVVNSHAGKKSLFALANVSDPQTQREFDLNCGRTHPLALRVEHDILGLLAEGELDQSSAVIGSDPTCDIQLTDEAVPPRLACIQVLDGQVLIIQLDRLQPNWLTTTTPFTHENFRLHLIYPASDQTEETVPQTNPLRPPVPSATPKIALKFITGSTPGIEWEVNRSITFVGRSAICPIREEEDGVPTDELDRVYGYFLLTPGGFWYVHLAEHIPAQFAGQPVTRRQLHSEEEIEIGRLRLRVLDRPPNVQPTPTKRGEDEEVIPLSHTGQSTTPEQTQLPVPGANSFTMQDWLVDRLAAATESEPAKPSLWQRVSALFKGQPPAGQS